MFDILILKSLMLFSKTSFRRKLACLLSINLTAILSIKGPRAYHGTATIGHAIYVIGGFDGVEYFNSVRCFNPIYKEWSEVAPMNAKRYLYNLKYKVFFNNVNTRFVTSPSCRL